MLKKNDVQETTASFEWTTVKGATEVALQQSPAGQDAWTASSTTVPIAPDDTAATVTGLTSGSDYDFRLQVTGGSNAGYSNVVSLTTEVAESPAKAIASFAFNGLTPAVVGTVDEANHEIELTVPYGTDLTNLVPTISHTGASVSPNTGVAQDFTSPVTYTVTAEDGTQQAYTVTVSVGQNPAKAIASFAFNGLTPAVVGTVDEANHEIELTVPYGTDVTSLVPTISHTGASVSPNTGVAQDFTSPVTYTVTAADGTQQAYAVTVAVGLNPAKAIASFAFNELTPAVVGTVDEANHEIELTVPYGTDLTNLVPTIAHTGASVSPKSGIAQDFTNPVTYTVTAADGTQQAYAVTVAVGLNPAKAITSFAFNELTPAVVGTVDEANHEIELTVPYGTDLTNLVPTIAHTGASVSPKSGIAQDFTNPVTYTVTAADGTQQAYAVTVAVGLNPAKAIASFAFNGLTPAVAGTIDEANHEIELTVPYGTDLTNLVPTISHTGASVSPNTGVAQDFTSPVTYTVTAADGTQQAYAVTVAVGLNPAKAITSFAFNGLTPAVVGTVDEANHEIELTVPYGTDLTNLVPTIAHTGASVSPKSGIAQDFTNPVTYTVTAADGTQQAYAVTVAVGLNPAKAIASFAFNGLTPAVVGTVDEANHEIELTVPYGTDLTNLVPTISHTGASVSPNTGVAQDFTSPVTYTVTAADGTQQAYAVTVAVGLNPAKAITSFAFNELTPAVVGTVDEANHEIELTVPYGTDVTSLVPTISHTGASVSPNTGVAQDFTSPVTYTVTAADGTQQAYAVTVAVGLNPAKAIASFAFNGLTPAVVGTVDEANHEIELTVPYGTDLTNLVPTISHTGASVSPNTGVAQDFTSPVTYTVTAEDGTQQAYTVTVSVGQNPAKAIASFAFNGLTPAVVGTVDEANHEIELTVPYGTDVTSLVPTISHTGASVSPNTGVAQDFTSPVTYTVTAADGTQQAYAVTVAVGLNPAKAIASFAFNELTPAVVGTVDEANHEIELTVPYGTDLTNLVPTIAHTGASVSPKSGIAQDFTNPVTYTVTAADGTHQAYTVRVLKSPQVPAVTSVTVSPTDAVIAQGGSEQLTAAVTVVGGAAQTVMWTSSDSRGKVSVDSTGKVSVVPDAVPGKYAITATSTFDGSKFGTATITVTATPTYLIAAIPDQSATPLTEGYAAGAQETKTISIINTGTGDLTNLSATISGSGANSFELTQPAATLNSGDPATSFNVKAKNGLTAGTYTAAITITADKMTDVTFTVTQTVNRPNAPANPQNLAARGEDRKVALTWQAVESASFYNVYMGTTSGQYGSEPVATVNEAYANVPDLENGTTYYFVVKAVNRGGLSAPSREANATPMTVPSAPTNVEAMAGSEQATVTFTVPSDDGGTPITGFEVTAFPGGITAVGTGSPIIVTGLTNGLPYTFTVRALNAAGSGEESAASPSVTPWTPSAGVADMPSTGTSDTSDSNVEILVNGKIENAGRATTTTVNNRTVTTITVDPEKLEEKLASEGNGAIVTIPVKSDFDTVIGEINGQMIKNMERRQAVLVIKTDNAAYTLPAQLLEIDRISEQLGQAIELQEIKIQIHIAVPAATTVSIVQNAEVRDGFAIVVPPLEFIVTATLNGQTVDVSRFNAYVERTVTVPPGTDPSRITTGIVIESDGTVRHVPTKVEEQDGKYVAVINSLTNSTYAVVWNPVEFADVADHWAKRAVNDMGSRMVVGGNGSGSFNPDHNVTRAEFAAMMVRALGLKIEAGESGFADVNNTEWYNGAVKTAYAYRLINGYGDGLFHPEDEITREQAMAIMAKAMMLTGLKAKLPPQEADALLQPFADTEDVSVWAKPDAADVLQAEIVTGKNGTKLAPQDRLTRAEAAVMFQRLLQRSELI
nr:DUF5018 domain-containing protein [Cohnella algarum]